MARRMPTWHWRILVRDHGPKNSTVRAVLQTLATWMNKDGFAFPSQDLIARGSCFGRRAVVNALKIARSEGWLAANGSIAGGQGWNRNEYVACIPDWVDLDAEDRKRLGRTVSAHSFAAVASAMEAEHGSADDRLHGAQIQRRHRVTKHGAREGQTLCTSGVEACVLDDFDAVHQDHTKSPFEVSTECDHIEGPTPVTAVLTCNDVAEPDLRSEDRTSDGTRTTQEPKADDASQGRTRENGLKLFEAYLDMGDGPERALETVRRMRYPVDRQDIDLLVERCEEVRRRSADGWDCPF